jgi:ribosome-binding protein aMBF1 (putative translation factor)
MTKEEIQIKLGDRIVQLRKSKGIKQIDLAHKLEIEDSALRRIEKGRTNCTLWLLHRISKALDISLPELLKFDK